MIKNILLSILFGLVTINSIAQNLVKIKIVSDEKEPIIGATVYIKN